MDLGDQLFSQIEDMCSAVTKDTYAACIQQGYAILIRLHDLELTQEQVCHRLLQYHNCLGDGMAQDCIADIMDFVVGWCAPQWYIWRSDGKFDRAQ